MLSQSIGRVLIAIGATLVLAVGCEDTTEPEVPGVNTDDGGMVEMDVGPDGGVLRSGDGVLTLTIPAGALGNTETITIQSVDPDQTDAAFDGIPIARAYELGPDGLDFGVPITVSLVTDQEALQDDGRLRAVPELLYTVGDDGEVEPLADATLEIDVAGNTVTVTGQLSHFSPLVQVTDYDGHNPHVAVYVEHPGDWDVGWPFVVDVSVQTDAISRASGAVRFFDETPESSPVVYEGDSPRILTTLQPETAQWEDMMLGFYECERVGQATIEFEVLFDGIGSTEMPQMPETLQFKLDLRCEDTPPPPGATVIPSPVSRPEGVRSLDCDDCDDCELCDEKSSRVVVTGSDGMAVMELPSGNVVAQPAMAPFWGGVYLRRPEGLPPSTNEDDEGLFGFGPDGAGMTFWSPTDDAFSWFQWTSFSQNVTDGTNVDGRATSGAVLATSFSLGRAEMIQVDAGSNLWGSTTVVESGRIPSVGGLVSAMARTPSGSSVVGDDILVVAEGTDKSSGQLYRTSRSSSSVTFVGRVGFSPRRIRFAADIAAVSNYESDDLSILRWVPGGVCEVTSTVPVGDGPIGIDLLQLSDGTVAILSTGFNDNTYTLVIVDPAGQLVSVETWSVPDGCEGPGHAAFLEGTPTQAIVSCNTTNNLALIPLPF